MARFVSMVLLCLTVNPIAAIHQLEIFGGSASIAAAIHDKREILGTGSSVQHTPEAISMRQVVNAGLRYSYYTSENSTALHLGLEGSGLFAKPVYRGLWRSVTEDSNGKPTAENLIAVERGNAPELNILRATGILGAAIPLHSVLTLEIGGLLGLSFGDAGYQLNYTEGNATRQTNGVGGFGLHAGLRSLLRFHASSKVSVGLEYRYAAEFFGNYVPFLAFVVTNSSLVTTSGHYLQMSVAYRFGSENSERAQPRQGS